MNMVNEISTANIEGLLMSDYHISYGWLVHRHAAREDSFISPPPQIISYQI